MRNALLLAILLVGSGAMAQGTQNSPVHIINPLSHEDGDNCLLKKWAKDCAFNDVSASCGAFTEAMAEVQKANGGASAR